ncbi:hypothetical protein BDQ17DRAFT_1432732 [Cyathus striatus]|nr:hypothetical protein BDQ17DRAFT_1432732 [Cyathus striatus]
MSINAAVLSLSQTAEIKIKDIGQSLLTLYAYDNLDIDLKHTVPTVEKPQATLVHLTSGTMLPLHHNIKLEDFNFSEELWKNSKLNPNTRPQDVPFISIEELISKIHPKAENHPSGLTQHDLYNKWKFLFDLIHFGPEGFRKFKSKLGEPDWIDRISEEKTSQVPLHGINISPSTPAQNAEALDNFFHQTEVGDSPDNPKILNPKNYVILVSGDLLTAQHKSHPDIFTLDEFSQTNLTWKDLENIAEKLVLEYVANAEVNELHDRSSNLQDEQHENILIQQQYFLLYEEISYALNHGDIG